MKDKDKTILMFGKGREEAIADGRLIDVSATAREAGIRYPTALTKLDWERYVVVPEGAIGQDEAGRLWDVLWMFRVAAANAERGTTSLRYTLWVHDGEEMQYCSLKAYCGPGDDLEPVITLMASSEG